MAEKIIRGVSCPSCGGSLEITEGTALLNCKFCGISLMVKGDRGIARFYVPMKQSREQVLQKVQQWFGGFNKASDLKSTASFTETFPVYVPFWRVNAMVVGWVLGDKKEGSGDKTKYVPVEKKVSEKYEFTCPSCDVGEFGVKWVDLKGDEILPFNLEEVQRHGMNFEVMTTPTDVLALCDQRFMERAEHSAGVDRKTFTRLFLINRNFTIVYYPLWIVRYKYKNRIYQVTSDAENADLLYGRAPGNNLYRVFCLIGSIMLADFILTSSMHSNSKDDHLGGLFILCVVLMIIGFWRFRYGGEVKVEQRDQLEQNDFWKLFPDIKFGDQDLKSLLHKV